MRDKSNTLADPREALLKLQTRQIENRPPPPDAGELDCSSHFEARAGHRVWKWRLYDLINTHYLKTPLRERQWFNVLDLAAECARDPRTTEIGNDKRNGMVDFLCRAINRGEFKDAKGRMQVANLHPSPHVPIRLDLKWLTFDQLVAFAKQGYLFTRRKECIECFAQNNIDFPTAWFPSESTGPDTQETPNEMSPAALPSHHPDKLPAGECWKLPDERPAARELGRAWFTLKQLWPEGGPPLSMSVRDITEDANKRRPKHSDSFSESTVGRLVKR